MCNMRNKRYACEYAEAEGLNTGTLDSLETTSIHPLRKYTYSNILKILTPKNENFQIKKKNDILHISAQNIDCGYSLEPPRHEPTGMKHCAPRTRAVHTATCLEREVA